MISIYYIVGAVLIFLIGFIWFVTKKRESEERSRSKKEKASVVISTAPSIATKKIIPDEEQERGFGREVSTKTVITDESDEEEESDLDEDIDIISDDASTDSKADYIMASARVHSVPSGSGFNIGGLIGVVVAITVFVSIAVPIVSQVTETQNITSGSAYSIIASDLSILIMTGAIILIIFICLR